jgi:hypothetical protein
MLLSEKYLKNIKIKIDSKIGEGAYNSVYKTNNPNVVFRMSNEKVSGDDVIADYKIESKFNEMAQQKYPGELVDYVFLDNSNSLEVGDSAFSYREAFDSDLETYLAKSLIKAYEPATSNLQRKQQLQNVTSALEDAVKVFDKLIEIGIFCSDVKPANFLVKTKRPVGYKGKRKKIYVRMIDLDGNFCTLDVFETQEELQIYRDLTVIQLYVMALNINKATTQITGSRKNLRNEGETAIIRSAQKENVCKNIDEIKRIVGKWFPGSRWKNVVDTFKWYVKHFDYKTKFCSKIINSPPRLHSRSRLRPRNRQRSRQRKSPRKGKQCKGKAPPGKVCNPKTGRWVLKNGKIGRMIVARASYKSPPAKSRRAKPHSRARRKKDKGCPAGKIRNPKTGRCVLKRGKIGRKILNGEI